MFNGNVFSKGKAYNSPLADRYYILRQKYLMLKFYRKNIKLIIWLIVLSFAAWGIGTISLSKESAFSYAGSVRGEKISHKEFLTTLRYYDLLSRAQVTKDGPPQNKKAPEAAQKQEPLSFDQLRGLTWQAIILSREAIREGITVSDQEVRDEVEKLFSTEGKFDSVFYQNWIHNQFRSRARDFEEAIRKHLATQKIRQKVLEKIPEADQKTRWVEWLTLVMSQSDVKDYTADLQNEN